MNKKISLLLLLLIAYTAIVAQQVVLKKGMLIKRSMKVKSVTYNFDGVDSLQHAVLQIEGSDLIIDFNDALLQGSNHKTQPDEFFGIAISIRNSRNVTIRNLRARGYKIALLAVGVEGLKLENCDFSYNYRQHLNSTIEREDVSDWMSYHNNEKDQWLRYGAAMYLKKCNGAIINRCKVTGGQNALMMMECNVGMIYNNDFSFNSGIGIGMYRCSGNKVMYNKLNFNVRGYSHDIYSRGQDSAGILVYEQSNDNTFYKNSVTHGGDGFFLWAGQSTMDTGKGGCNGNRIIENDFSYAPANGIEATFSSNQIIGNRIFECDHGIWGGYSHETSISRNQFRNNKIGIAIEHGQQNRIDNNIFYQDQEAIRLWSRKEQPKGWGYAENHDTRSVNYQITLNSFNRNHLVYHLSGTDSLQIHTNTYSNCDQLFLKDSSVTNLDTMERNIYDSSSEPLPFLKNAMDPFKGNGKLAGRKNILMTEWGPYDFRYPVIVHSNATDTSGIITFNVLGPKGKWRIITSRGIENMETSSDTFPAKIIAMKKPGDRREIEVVADFIPSASFTDQFGKKVEKVKPYRFVYRDFFQPIDFTVSWFSFDSLNNPLKTDYLQRIKTQRPFYITDTKKLEYTWWDGIQIRDLHVKQFLTIAEGNATFLKGNYAMNVTWDDAVRVYLDGRLLLDEWTPSLYEFDQSPHRTLKIHLEGSHHIRVEHVELGGFATLMLQLKKIGY